MDSQESMDNESGTSEAGTSRGRHAAAEMDTGTRVSTVMKNDGREVGQGRISAVINAISDGVVVANRDGILEYFNRAAHEILGVGLTEEDPEKWPEYFGIYLSDGVTPCPAARLPLVRALSGEVVKNFEMVIRNHALKSPILLTVTATPISDELGNNDGGVVVFRDITESRKAEELLEQHKQELAHMMRLTAMNEMASGMAHELNQPLSAIVNYVSGICLRLEKSDRVTDELRSAMQQAVAEAERAAEIIKSLRRLVSKRAPHKSQIPVRNVIANALRTCRIEAERLGILVEFPDEDCAVEVFVDPIQIEQVLVCLILNSIESLKESGRILKRVTIRVADEDPDHVTLRVQDTGPGVSPELLDKIFDSYFSTKEDGLGMGLAISRSIIESHGGRIWVDTDCQNQTCFQITLPAANGAGQPG